MGQSLLMKRILIGIGAVLGLLLAFMTARTLMVPAPVVEAAGPPIAVDAAFAARHLSQAVKFQTVTSAGEKQDQAAKALDDMEAWMEATYPYFHEAAGPEVFGKSLLFTWIGKNPNLLPVLLLAHLDVAPVAPGTEKSWIHAPFSGDIADDFVWGRGTLDDKGPLVAILEAGNRLAQGGFQPERTIMFAIGHDSESGGRGSAAIAKALQSRGLHFAWLLDEGSAIHNQPYPGVNKPVAFLSIAGKGLLSLELTARGPDNAARLQKAVAAVANQSFSTDLDDIQRAKFAAIAPLAPFGDKLVLSNLWALKFVALGHMEAEPAAAASLRTTMAPPQTPPGGKDAARAIIDFELHPRDSISAVTARVKNAIADPKIEVAGRDDVSSAAPKTTAVSGAGFSHIADLIKSTYGVPVAPDMMTRATDSRHWQPIADEVLYFSPYHADPGDLARVHGANERLAISDLGAAVGFYMRLIQELK